MSRIGKYIFCVAIVVVALLVSGVSYAIEPGNYCNYDKKGNLISTLTVQQAGSGVWYAEIKLPQGKTEEGEEVFLTLDGKIEKENNKDIVTVTYSGELEGDKLFRWTYPFYLDVKDNKMMYLSYQLMPDKKGVRISVDKKAYPKSMKLPDIKGIYVPEGSFVLTKSLAAYVIETADEELVWSYCSQWDVKDWWFDRLEAGEDIQLGNHPSCVWAEPEDGFGNKIGSYLLADDLSAFYIDSQLIWAK